ncbi:MAG: hypothetical protein OFPI_11820 [Osedax symbiont Rs2]|nr:MAG: hypothetical protein OFPI_11820 [Osedax symbiont Rs2]
MQKSQVESVAVAVLVELMVETVAALINIICLCCQYNSLFISYKIITMTVIPLPQIG